MKTAIAATWESLTRLEPDLLELERDLREGRLSFTQLMVRGRLARLVGQAAAHPALRKSESYRAAYAHLRAVPVSAAKGKGRP